MNKFLGSLLALSVCAICAAGQDAQWRPVRGQSLRELFADQDLGDGVHYAYQFHRDGRLVGMNMGKLEHGTWKLSSSELCYRWERRKAEEECYEVRRLGNSVRMFRDGYEAFSGTLSPITHQPSQEKTP